MGDLHGEILKVHSLFRNLVSMYGEKKLLEDMTLVFLGDYCDRGPNTRLVIDWLCALKSIHPRVYTIAGNHGRK